MPQNRDYTDAETLHELYWNGGLTQQEMADELGCSLPTIVRWMGKLDVPTRMHDHAGFHTRQEDGYECWYDSGQRVYVHRLLAVAEWGVESVQGKKVHHKSEIPWDNRPENLETLSRTEHRGKHAKTQGKERKALAYAYEFTDMSSYDLADVTPYSQASVIRIHGEYFE